MGVCRLRSAAGLSQGCRAVYDEMTARLLDSAVGVFAHRGFAGARVGEIARRAGLTTGAIYARWTSKADLLAAAVAHAFDEAVPEQTRTRGEPAPQTPHDLVAMFGVGIADAAEVRDVIIQAAASAAVSDAVAASLTEFLNNEARHLGCIVEAAKDAGLIDPACDTAALALLFQAVAVGAHLVLTAGLDEHHVPTADAWEALLVTLIGSATATGPLSSQHP